MNNYAFIDTQNVNLWVRGQWWKIDRKKFFIYLREKLSVQRAYLFLGYIPGNHKMYSFFKSLWYKLIFKPVLQLHDWQTKGNVDAELVLQAMIDYCDYDKAILVSGDGDFACLVKYLSRKEKLARLLVPNEKKYSMFLRSAAKHHIDGLNNIRPKWEYLW